MRVTSNTYTSLVINSSQTAQQQLATLQQEISSGNSIQNPSDDPSLYSQAAQDQNTLAQLGQYTQAAATATTMTAQNNQAMTSLHQIVAQAGEYLAGVSSNMSSGSLQNIGTEMQGLVNELTRHRQPEGLRRFLPLRRHQQPGADHQQRRLQHRHQRQHLLHRCAVRQSGPGHHRRGEMPDRPRSTASSTIPPPAPTSSAR